MQGRCVGLVNFGLSGQLSSNNRMFLNQERELFRLQSVTNTLEVEDFYGNSD